MVFVVGVAPGAEGAVPLSAELRKELEGLSPDERRARLRQYRDAQNERGSEGRKDRDDKDRDGKAEDDKDRDREGLGDAVSDNRRARTRDYWERHRGVSAQEWEKRREELKGLSSEERKARIKQWRAEEVGHRDDPKTLTPEERLKKREEIRVRLEKELAQLSGRQERGELTEEEGKRLRHLRELRKRFDRSRPSGSGGGSEERRERPGPNNPCASSP